MKQGSAPSPEMGREPASESCAREVANALALMLVRVGGRWLAIDACRVTEVAAKGAITRVPTAPRHVLGVAGLRGGLVPVVSLERMLGVGGAATPGLAATLPRLVVVAAEYELGLVVDEISGIIEDVPLTHAADAGAPGRPAFLREEFEWEGQRVRVLDVARLAAVAAGQGRGGD